MSRPSSKMQLERIIHVSKMHDRKELRQKMHVDDELASALLIIDENFGEGGGRGWLRRVRQRGMELFKLRKSNVAFAPCESIRSIDQLYLQAKTLVPYLSRLVQVWAYTSNGIFRVKRFKRSAGAAAAAGGADIDEESCKETYNAPRTHQEAGDVADAQRAGSSMCTSMDTNTASVSATECSTASGSLSSTHIPSVSVSARRHQCRWGGEKAKKPVQNELGPAGTSQKSLYSRPVE